MNRQPLISIITVTFNAEKFIERTLLSIAEQNYQNLQSIIIDGISKDNTLTLVNKLKIPNNIVVSEKDNGLYDAMNKGIDIATGDYIIFMNAGDLFYEKDTILKAFEKHNNEDFIYGNTIVVDDNGKYKSYHKQKPSIDEFSYKSFIEGMVICHQSMFIKRSCAEKFNDMDYKLSCDTDWCIRSLKRCETYRDTNTIISKFLDGGISQRNRWTAVKERFTISRKHFGLFPTIIANIKMLFVFLLKSNSKEK